MCRNKWLTRVQETLSSHIKSRHTSCLSLSLSSPPDDEPLASSSWKRESDKRDSERRCIVPMHETQSLSFRNASAFRQTCADPQQSTSARAASCGKRRRTQERGKQPFDPVTVKDVTGAGVIRRASASAAGLPVPLSLSLFLLLATSLIPSIPSFL